MGRAIHWELGKQIVLNDAWQLICIKQKLLSGIEKYFYGTMESKRVTQSKLGDQIYFTKLTTCYVYLTSVYDHIKWDITWLPSADKTECLDLIEERSLARTPITKHFKTHQEYKSHDLFNFLIFIKSCHIFGYDACTCYI